MTQEELDAIADQTHTTYDEDMEPRFTVHIWERVDTPRPKIHENLPLGFAVRLAHRGGFYRVKVIDADWDYITIETINGE